MIKINYRICLLVLFLITHFFSKGQAIKPANLQELIQQNLARAEAATVWIGNYDTLTKRVYKLGFSGTIISKDGYIVTCAHATATGKYYRIKVPNGSVCTAVGLGRIEKLDIAVLKILDEGEWPFAEMGWSSSLRVNEPVISIGYPASIYPARPVIRFGYVADLEDWRRKKIRTTCLMEQGDSGGPIFDLFGRVVGTHSAINVVLEDNFEAPIDDFRKYWTALLRQEDYSGLPSEESIAPDSLSGAKVYFDQSNAIEMQLTNLESKLGENILQLTNADSSKAVGLIVKAMGNLKKENNKSYIVSKSSLITEKVSVAVSGKSVEAKVVYRDDARDLVLLQIEQKINEGIDLSGYLDNKELLHSGKLLVSPQPQRKGLFSVLGSPVFDLGNLYSGGSFGSAGIQMKNGHVSIEALLDNSAAKQAGIKVGDEVISLNGAPVNSLEAFSDFFLKTKPGDEVAVVYIRDGKEDKANIKLGVRQPSTSTHAAERFAGGKSARRDGFKQIYTHDAALKPMECGGPVFDIDGQFMGINIARFSRTTSLVISPAEVFSFFEIATLGLVSKK